MAFAFRNGNDDDSDDGEGGEGNDDDYCYMLRETANICWRLIKCHAWCQVLYIYDITEYSQLYKVLLLFPFYRWENQEKLLINGDYK